MGFDLSIIEMFVAMIICHFWADFSLQNNFVGVGKNRHFPAGNKDIGIPWWYMMTAHCAIHAGVFWLLTGSFLICGLEFLSHMIIDILKCEKKFGIHVDQALHILMKASYLIILAS